MSRSLVISALAYACSALFIVISVGWAAVLLGVIRFTLNLIFYTPFSSIDLYISYAALIAVVPFMGYYIEKLARVIFRSINGLR